jgi:hypothetical protein
MNIPFFRGSAFYRFRPWLFFLVFFISNSLLSYFVLPTGMSLIIGMGGILVPFLFAFWIYQPPISGSSNLFSKEFLPSVPFWFWIALFLLVIFSRFYKLTTLSLWPHYDESLCNYFAYEFSQKWDGRLFYGYNQMPPFFIWIQGCFLRIFHPSLAALWSFPAFASVLFFPIGYWASRKFFSISFSFILALLLGLSFWPLYMGRFSFVACLVPIWEVFVLGLWGHWQNQTSMLDQVKASVFLGLGLGLGAYIYIPHWLIFAPFLGLGFFHGIFIQRSNRMKSMIWFLGSMFVLLLPLIIAGFEQNYGYYLHDLWSFSSGNELHQQVGWTTSYLACLFWGPHEFNAYAPFWGGFLNPILGGLFFLGFLEVLNNLRIRKYLWILGAFFFFTLPAFLSQTLEPFRLLSLMPVLLVLTGLGLVRLGISIPSVKPIWILALLLIPSFGLDFYHLVVRYPQGWESSSHWKSCSKSQSHYQSYLVLKRMEEDKGPGLIFSDFVPGNFDMSLFLADYEFNAVDNPDLSFSGARWAAVLTNANFKPFLEKRFPDGKAYFVSKGEELSNGGWMLWVVPVTPQRLDTFRRWQKADLALSPYIDHYLSFVNGQPYTPVFSSHLQTYPDFQGDPFLETLFWEKTADDFMKMGPSFHPQAISALLTATQKGYASAHLFYLMGTLYFVDQNHKGAQWAFRQALKAPIDLTASKQSLSWIPSKPEASQ